MRRERKVVTVLFADLVGFTARAESLDPEDVEAILRPYHERLRTELEQRGGTVEKFVGDAVMAVFGAPVAHEDDPERAVRAALAIRDGIVDDGKLEVRVAREHRRGARQHRRASGARRGDGRGRRRQHRVAPAERARRRTGSSSASRRIRATRHTIEYRDHEPVEAKGKAEPVPVWEAVRGARARRRRAARPGDAARRPRARARAAAVGAFERVRREQLHAALHDRRRPRHRQEPPRRRAATASSSARRSSRNWRQRPLAAVRRGRCVLGVRRDGQGAGRHPRDRRARPTPSASCTKRSRCYARRGRRLGRGAAAAARRARRGGDGARDESFAAWRRFVEALAEQRPTVLVFEDLHWADDELLDFVDELVDWVDGVPLLVVATARPELLRAPAGLGRRQAKRADASRSRRSPTPTRRGCSPRCSTRSCFRRDQQQELLARAGGNPLYAEQFARMFAERGDAGGDLPETVQGIIAARLDSLPPEEKELLLDAAVLGRTFWRRRARRRRRRSVACTRCSGRSSSGASAAARSRARASSRSRICSSATSRTRSSRVPAARRSTCARRGGSSRSPATAARISRSCARITTSPRSSSSRRPEARRRSSSIPRSTRC